MARSDHARYSSRADKIDRYAAKRPRPTTRRAATRQAIVARELQEAAR